MSGRSTGPHDDPRWYEIRVQGRLEPRWVAWFDGMTLTPGDDGTTSISGPVVDQAALHGLLRKLRDVGLPLISVEPARVPDASRARSGEQGPALTDRR